MQLSKHRIRADLSKGYVDLKFLEEFENIPATSVKIKIKNVSEVSYFESMR
jgi:hypothetical protein